MTKARYRPPSNVPDPSSPIFKAWLLAQLREIAEDHQLIGSSDAPTIIQQERVDVPAGATRRVSPTTLGMIAVLEAPSAENSGQTATLIIESPAGELKVVASPHVGADGKVAQTLINGSAQATYSLAGVVTFTSNGVNSWKTQAQVPAETPPTGNAALLDAALSATFHLQTPHASLPAARVGADTDGVTLDYDTPGQVKWDFTPIDDQRLLLNDAGEESEPREGTIHQAMDFIGGSEFWVFDGVDDRIDFGNVLSKERTDSFSLGIWFRSTSTSASELIGKTLQSGTTRRGYEILVDSTNIAFGLANNASGGANNIAVNHVGAYIDGNWHFILVTYNGSSNASGVLFYVDGAAVSTTTTVNSLSQTTISAAIYTIGARDGAANIPFTGALRHGQMWSRVLTAAEVAEAYGSGAPPDLLATSMASVLQHWVPLDENDTAAAGGIADHSTSNFDGTAEGSLAPTGAIGSLPVRGMALWQLLSPGTIDHPLVSNGPAALPSYRQVPLAGSGLQYLPGGVLQVRVPPGGQRTPQFPQSPVLAPPSQRGATGAAGPRGATGSDSTFPLIWVPRPTFPQGPPLNPISTDTMLAFRGYPDSATGLPLPIAIPNLHSNVIWRHYSFEGGVNNLGPVNGFTAGGDMTFSQRTISPTYFGLALRCSVPLGSSGYAHLGNLPTQLTFADPQYLRGFRVLLELQTVNAGDDYDFMVGFGDDISDMAGTSLQFGTNSLFFRTQGDGAGGFSWGFNRQSGGVASNPTGPVGAVGDSVMLEAYRTTGTTWQFYVNRVAFTAGSANVPTTGLNFGWGIDDDGGGAVDFVVDIYQVDIFTDEMPQRFV